MSFVRGTPIKYNDPSGHDKCTGTQEFLPDCEFINGEWTREWSSGEDDPYYYGDLSTKEAFAAIKEGGDVVISVVVEPYDWYLTGKDCLQGNCSPLALLGLLPFVPSSLGNKADDIIGLLDLPKRVNWPHHHVLPQRFRTQFANLGIDIDKYLVSLPRELHERIHAGARGGLWNNAWETWLSNNPNATAQEVFKQIGVMIHEFGLDGYINIVP